ncbi:MAG: proteasome accessory factor PafA2 family protein, partial [Anaerolineae bacterium]|nr:proteasome accessory factor PafA2 family protein [Anaerolineae bacterium]
MALKERVHSLETEYAVSYVADRGRKPNAGSIVDALKRALAQSHGLATTEYIVNGAKLYHDVGHAEWAQPECRNARELAAYDKAADHQFIHTVVPRADRVFAREGGQGRLIVAKNNADPYGNTYGCHENYQMQRDADLLHSRDFLRYVAQCLIPFLVSRQLLAGSGHLVVERGRRGQQIEYHLSQRSSFIETVVSHDTTKARPIFNTGRERESFATGQHRRLHQVLGDANLSGWATYIKSGTTGLVLRLIEDLFIDHVPA